MNFGIALEHVRAGGRARCEDWPPGIWLYLGSVSEQGQVPFPLLRIGRDKGKPGEFGGSNRDLLAGNWILL